MSALSAKLSPAILIPLNQPIERPAKSIRPSIELLILSDTKRLPFLDEMNAGTNRNTSTIKITINIKIRFIILVADFLGGLAFDIFSADITMIPQNNMVGTHKHKALQQYLALLLVGNFCQN